MVRPDVEGVYSIAGNNRLILSTAKGDWFMNSGDWLRYSGCTMRKSGNLENLVLPKRFLEPCDNDASGGT